MNALDELRESVRFLTTKIDRYPIARNLQQAGVGVGDNLIELAVADPNPQSSDT